MNVACIFAQIPVLEVGDARKVVRLGCGCNVHLAKLFRLLDGLFAPGARDNIVYDRIGSWRKRTNESL